MLLNYVCKSVSACAGPPPRTDGTQCPDRKPSGVVPKPATWRCLLIAHPKCPPTPPTLGSGNSQRAGQPSTARREHPTPMSEALVSVALVTTTQLSGLRVSFLPALDFRPSRVPTPEGVSLPPSRPQWWGSQCPRSPESGSL